MTDRPYELVLLGATGYTGRLTAEYIQEHVPTDLRWAIAGRNGKKLQDIAEELKKLNPDRIQPGVEVVEHKNPELTTLASKTKVLITTVGPYARFGEPVVKACVDGGAHYLDVTGEIPFTYDMMRKYHEPAKAKGICIIPHCGIDSVPSDILAYLCAKTVREKCNTGLRDCITSLQELSFQASGGTAASAIGMVESYPLKFLAASLKPTALCSIAPPKAKPSTMGMLSALLGWRHVKDLGLLTDSPNAGADVGIVYRSWGLLENGAFYGPNFAYSEFMRTSNILAGALTHYLLGTALFALYLRPFRWLIRKLAYVQGMGQDHEEAKKGLLNFKAVGVADEERKRRAFASFRYQGAGYYMTGITLVEAAMVLLRDGDVLAKRLNGMVTPATLEMKYVERLQKTDIKIEYGMLDN